LGKPTPEIWEKIPPKFEEKFPPKIWRKKNLSSSSVTTGVPEKPGKNGEFEKIHLKVQFKGVVKRWV